MKANGSDPKGLGGRVQPGADVATDPVSQRARTVFVASTLQLDSDSERRLRDLRLHALKRDTPKRNWRWIPPAATAAALGLAVLLVWPRAVQSPEVAQSSTASEPAPSTMIASGSADIDINDVLLSDNAPDPELLGNLAFYDWLAKQPSMHATGG